MKIWLSEQEIAALPTTGQAWDTVVKYANQADGSANLIDQESKANTNCLAAALVYARTGDRAKLDKVKKSLENITAFDVAKLGRALALGRELAAYVIAADLIDYNDAAFSKKLRELLTAKTTGGPASLIKCQEDRPNNWGMHATASRIAVALYLGDANELDQAANIFKGWLGDRNAYAGFTYGGPEKDLSWQADPTNPVGINPVGATIQGHNVDGMLPDDIRRSGSFTWPPSGSKAQMYSWEGLQGAVVAAQLLTRAGYPAWDWCDKALLRAAKFLYGINWPATGDDGWQPWLLNAAYGTSFPTVASASPGKNMGFTQWTHSTPIIVKPPVDPPPPPPPGPGTQPDVAAALVALQQAKANTVNTLAILQQAITALGG